MHTHMNGTNAIALLLLSLLPSFLLARPISPDEAATAAQNWLRRSPTPLGARISPASSPRPAVRAATDADGRKLFYLVQAEKGTVVTSTDDALPPVIAFTETQAIPETDENPLWAILMSGAKSRMDSLEDTARSVRPAPRAAALSSASLEWASLLAPAPMARSPRPLGNGLATLGDIRVAPLIRSKWHQEGVHFLNGDSVLLYNYFTPSNYVCGCVATAMAQVMRYHEFPRNPVEAVSRPCGVNGVVTEKTMQGGLYDWDLMELEPPLRPADDVCRAIGKLCYDVGVAASMNWATNGSGTAGYASIYAFKEAFGYANAAGYTRPDTFSDRDTARVLCSNLDAGLPVLVGLQGHEVVGDGYGYENGTLYVHLNMGWGGGCDAWYHMPDVSCDDGTFHYVSATFNDVTYNISPTGTGVLLTGRVTDPSGKPLRNVSVSAVAGNDLRSGRTNEKGIYALWVAPAVTYDVTASKGGTTSKARSVRVPQSEDSTYTFSSKEAKWYFQRYSGRLGNSCGNDLVLDPPPSPPNDDFVDAIAIEGARGRLETSNRFASQEPGERDHAGLRTQTSIWWKWTAPSSGRAVFSTEGSEPDTIMGIYTGTALDSLTEIVSNDDSPDANSSGWSECVFDAVQGTAYYIAVSGYQNTYGKIVLSFVLHDPPAPNPTPVIIGGSLRPGDGEAISLTADGFALRFRAPEANRVYILEATMDLRNEPFFDTGARVRSTAADELIEFSVSPPLPPAAFFRVVAE